LSAAAAGSTLLGMTTTLITGANKGLGYETARRLVEAGHDVWMGARDEARGREAASTLGARYVTLDVTEDASVAAAVDVVGSLDVLVNNAGIVGRRTPVTETTADDLRSVYETNVLGPLRVFQAFRGALERSSHPVVVNVSSGMGSITWTSDPERLESTIVALGYPSSKAALNMLTSQLAKAFPAMRINAVDPGYTATDFNDHRGTQTVEQGAEVIVRLAQIGPDGPTGTFSNAAGPVPW
jgi:NAD(P)-dependent dehydrogenase (short-subunit alcohol dehydrogenase family)